MSGKDATGRIFDDGDLCGIEVIKMRPFVFFGFLHDYTAQEQDGYDIRDRHQAVQNIGQVPDQIRFNDRTDEDCAGAAECDRSTDTDDIRGADR